MAKTLLVCSFVGILLIGLFFFPVPAYAGVGATPSTINFGSVTVSTSSTAATITLTNTSHQAVSIQQVTSSLAQFAVLAPAMPLYLAPRSTLSFQVVFTPNAAGTFSGNIVVNPGRKGGGGPISIAVLGVGLSNSSQTQSHLLSASSSSLNFGNILVGSSTSQPFTLTNTGTGNISISQVAAAGAGFTVSGFPGAVTLAAGQSLPLTANYSPASAGAAVGSISIVSTATNSPLAISLSGTGAQPQISVAPSSLSFGNLVVGTSGTQKLTISNPGTATLNVTQATLAGTGFTTSGLALPLSLAPGGASSFNVGFAPASAGAVSGSITLISNAPASSLVIPFSGSGVASTLQLSVSPTSLSFGNLVTGTSATKNVTISNTGNSSVSVSQISATGTGFSTSGVALPLTLAAGQSTSLGVKFAPASAGTLSGSVTVVSNAANSPATLTVSGTGVQAQIVVVPSSVSFGSASVGVTNSQTLTIQNPGTSALSVTQASLSGAGFTFFGLALPLSVPAGGSSTFNVGFTPASAGSASGSITLISNTTNSPLVVPFSGTGIASTLQLSASPASLNFGSLTTGASAMQTVTISNTGNSSVSISQLSASGTGYATNAVAVPLSLAAGQSTSFSVTFAPASTGSLSGSVTVVSNATNSPLVIALSGTGATPASHSVSLSWVPSSSTYSGFNVYRGTTSGGPYTRVDSSMVPSATYTDATVTSGQTYYYVATQVDTTGAESGYSSEVAALIP